MSKAEDFAYKKYPQSKKGVLYDLVRNSIIQGYQQAEEDLKLTWEDIVLIETISKEFIKNNTTPMTNRDYYQEVLKQFNEKKGKIGMKQLKIATTASAIVTLDGLDIDDVIKQAADLAHEVLEELSIYRQENELDSDTFACEGSCCAFLDLIDD